MKKKKEKKQKKKKKKNVLNSYISDNLKIENNEVKLENLKEGTYEYKLIRTDDFYNKPLLFYQSANSQNLVQTGNINTKNISLKVVVKSTNIKIIKLDQDTNSDEHKNNTYSENQNEHFDEKPVNIN